MLPLLANMGTPLMWLSFGHLTVGNALVAVGEAMVLDLVWKAPFRRAFLWMLLANYLSAALGCAALALAHDTVTWRPAEPHDLLPVIWGAAGLAYVLTVLVEWPFVAPALGAGFRPTWRSFRASVVVQTASYAVLLPMYANASNLAALTETTRAVAADVAGGLAGTRVYYVTADGAVRSVAVDGSDDRDEGKEPDGRLLWISVDPDTCELRVWDERRRATVWSKRLPAARVAGGQQQGFGAAASLADDDRWEVRVGFWSVEGLAVSDTRDDRHHRLGFETPFVSLASRSATLLPGGRVVYSLGEHVVLLDLETLRLATLAHGHGPVVVVDEAE